MVTIQASSVEGMFNKDGVDYPQGQYTIFYEEIDGALEVGIRDLHTKEVLVHPQPPNQYTNGVDPYGSIVALLTDLAPLLGFNSAESAALKTAKYIIGWQDFADSNTSEATPLVQPNISGGDVKLTNNNNDTLTDGNTNVNAETTVVGLNDLWDTTSNTLVFKDTGIEKNDLFDIRVHINVSASIISQDFSIRIDFYDDIDATGNLVFSLREHVSTETLSAGVFRERLVNMDGFIGESILNGSAEIYLEGTKSFEVEVVGWNIKIFKIAR